jgi:hypothetical protein
MCIHVDVRDILISRSSGRTSDLFFFFGHLGRRMRVFEVLSHFVDGPRGLLPQSDNIEKPVVLGQY